MKKVRAIPAKFLLCLLTLMLVPTSNLGCSAQKKVPMLDQGTVDLDTPDSTLTLVRSSQTVAALNPKGADGVRFHSGRPAQRSIQGRILASFNSSGSASSGTD